MMFCSQQIVNKCPFLCFWKLHLLPILVSVNFILYCTFWPSIFQWHSLSLTYRSSLNSNDKLCLSFKDFSPLCDQQIKEIVIKGLSQEKKIFKWVYTTPTVGLYEPLCSDAAVFPGLETVFCCVTLVEFPLKGDFGVNKSLDLIRSMTRLQHINPMMTHFDKHISV